VIALAGAALGRLALDRAEYDADDVAVRLDLGSVLLAVLKMFERRQPQGRDRLEQALGIKPLLSRRIERLSGQVPEPPPPADPWERLLRRNHPSVAAELSTQAQRGELTDVDRARIGLTLRHAAAEPGGMEIAVRELRTFHGAAFLHRSGQRDLPARRTDHDLLRDQVRLGLAVDEPRNPDELQDQPFGLDTAMLTTSLLAIGPPGAGKTRGFAVPIVEHLCLAALANAASVVVIDPKGDDFDLPGMFDVDIDLANPDGSWGFDLYGGAQTAEEAADRLASALLPPEISGDKAYFVDASKNALYQALAAYDAAYRRYPTIRVLVGLLKGDERVVQSLRDKLASSGRLGEHEHLLAGREHQRRRRDDPAASLVERLGLLDRPSLVKLLDEKRHKFSMGEINQPLRVRIALPRLYRRRPHPRPPCGGPVRTGRSVPAVECEHLQGLVIDEAAATWTTTWPAACSICAPQRRPRASDPVARGFRREPSLDHLRQHRVQGRVRRCRPAGRAVFADYWGTQWVER
jgi:hypothetical protein